MIVSTKDTEIQNKRTDRQNRDNNDHVMDVSLPRENEDGENGLMIAHKAQTNWQVLFLRLCVLGFSPAILPLINMWIIKRTKNEWKNWLEKVN